MVTDFKFYVKVNNTVVDASLGGAVLLDMPTVLDVADAAGSSEQDLRVDSALEQLGDLQPNSNPGTPTLEFHMLASVTLQTLFLNVGDMAVDLTSEKVHSHCFHSLPHADTFMCVQCVLRQIHVPIYRLY